MKPDAQRARGPRQGQGQKQGRRQGRGQGQGKAGGKAGGKGESKAKERAQGGRLKAMSPLSALRITTKFDLREVLALACPGLALSGSASTDSAALPPDLSNPGVDSPPPSPLSPTSL